jgi:hypothetical protein
MGTPADGPIISALLPKGYKIMHELRTTRGGGVAVIHRDGLPVRRLNTSYSAKSFELLDLTLCLGHDITLGLIYNLA